jgi:hypothetical protein
MDIPARTIRCFVLVSDIKPRAEEKKMITEIIAQAEGFTLASTKNPRGTDDTRTATNGTRRRCLGRATITIEKAKTANIELAILIEIID